MIYREQPQCVKCMLTHLQATVPLDKLEHVSARCILHGNGQVRGRKEDLFELDDVRVAEVAVAYNFALHMFCYLTATLEQAKALLQ